MKAVYQERDRLEALSKRLHSLSLGSSQELARMKEQRQQLREELEQKEAWHGESLRPVWDGPKTTTNLPPLPQHTHLKPVQNVTEHKCAHYSEFTVMSLVTR